MYSKTFAKDEMISTEILSITDVTKNSVNSEPFNNSKSSLNNQQNLGSNLHRVWVLIYIGSGLKTPQESYLDKSILTQSETSLICL